MDENEAIRAKAHELWEAEGRPHGRAERHWEEASEIVALRGGAAATLVRPVEETLEEPVEPAAIAAQQGEVPVLTDLGDEGGAPSRRKAAELKDTLGAGQRKAPKGKNG